MIEKLMCLQKGAKEAKKSSSCEIPREFNTVKN